MNLRAGFTLGDWTVLPLEGRLVSTNGDVHIQPKSMDVLLCLAAYPGEVVERDTMLREVWGDRAQTDEPLTRCIGELRRALGETRGEPDYILTIPKRGYQLLKAPAGLPTEGKSEELPADGATPPRFNTLKKFAIAALVLLTTIVLEMTFGRFLDYPKTAIDAPDHSIAVLPFENMSDDASNRFFSDGLSEELLNLLAKIPELRVAARTSSFSFRERPDVNISEIARELNVAHVLEGSVRKSGDQVRITAQLIKADDGFHLWSESYDRKLDNIFAIQDEIAAAVVSTLKITLLEDTPRVRETDPEAYQLYLEGQYFAYQRTVESIGQAILYFKAALEIDPKYTPAWVELANNYLWSAGIGALSIEEGNALAEQAIDTALRIDPEYAWIYYLRGFSRIANKREYQAGIEDYEHALMLDPGNAVFVTAAGIGALAVGRFDESITYHLSAMKLDPVKPEVYTNLGKAYLFSRRFHEAEMAFRQNLVLSPSYTAGQYRLGRSLLHQGRLEEALTTIEKESQPHYRGAGLGMVYHAMGRAEESDLALQAVIDGYTDEAAVQIAEVFLYRGEMDKAFEWLDHSLEVRDAGLTYILGVNSLTALHGDPRWEPFLARLGLLEYWLEMPPKYGGGQEKLPESSQN